MQDLLGDFVRSRASIFPTIDRRESDTDFVRKILLRQIQTEAQLANSIGIKVTRRTHAVLAEGPWKRLSHDWTPPDLNYGYSF
jgi:hypothetical protein